MQLPLSPSLSWIFYSMRIAVLAAGRSGDHDVPIVYKYVLWAKKKAHKSINLSKNQDEQRQTDSKRIYIYIFSNQSYTKWEIEGQTGGILTWLSLAFDQICSIIYFIKGNFTTWFVYSNEDFRLFLFRFLFLNWFLGLYAYVFIYVYAVVSHINKSLKYSRLNRLMNSQSRV